ncbi:hypothetical protein K474DRAFT_1686802 [Panus rudis PR-1116 ss-1]|nr:hypothetical protein K474DRAFT_1686802 [Panus rudis PR-1116 ss-1]
MPPANVACTARKCDSQGNFLPSTAPPPPRDDTHDWAPFADRASFSFAQFAFERAELSAGKVNELLEILRAKAVLDDVDDDNPPLFNNHDDMLDTIDDITLGDAPWYSFNVCYEADDDQPIPAYSASWKSREYTVYARNTETVLRNIAQSADFKCHWDYTPYVEYTAAHKRRWSNLMSGDWAWRQASKVAEDAATHGAMLCPIILGADKTTVSVATGHTEFHPVYINEFRLFKKQLYHASLTRILEPLLTGMTAPQVIRCPDGHFRRTIYEIGPFIADYPEQVLLAGIVQGWCPKCLAPASNLDHCGEPRFRELTEVMRDSFASDELWDTFGIVADVIPFTYNFPRADIHELLTPDILHQLVKGTFKDHLFLWVQEYITMNNDPAEANRIMDDIDRRIAAVPLYPGLRRFPEGRRFKQWTGNDSKALMKVVLPAIVGYVPDRIIQCIAAFLDFCYYARYNSHSCDTLAKMDAALRRFHDLRQIFIDEDIRPDGFCLPRQHSLHHYIRSIRLFGSPNGLCSSITESKHIPAVKRPWRRSSKNNPLIQIFNINTRLSKIAAAHHSPSLTMMFPRNSFVTISNRADIFLMQPALPELCRRFLFDQLHADDPDLNADEVPLAWCPQATASVSTHHMATAIFYAPSEACGIGGMHREMIRCVPNWCRAYPHYDTVLISLDVTQPGMRGMSVARVLSFLRISHEFQEFPCALVEWFTTRGDAPDPVTGMWIVEPEWRGNRRHVGIVHVEAIVRPCHLIGVYGTAQIPTDFHFSYSHDTFKAFYVNHYIDYHAHECIP